MNSLTQAFLDAKSVAGDPRKRREFNLGVRQLLRRAQREMARAHQRLGLALAKAETIDHTIGWASTIQRILVELAEVESHLTDFRQCIKNPPKPPS